MKQYKGHSVFGGIAIGKIQVYQKNQQIVKRYRPADSEPEIKRFHQARETAVSQLGALYQKAVREVGESNASIFQVHQMMLEDEDYLNFVENMIRTQEVNAEYAVAAASDNFSEMFSAMDDEYMRERAADVRDISQRVLSVLGGYGGSQPKMDAPVIVMAEDLSPSETVQLDKNKVLSFITVHGSSTSHTAILARTMGIPALVGTDIHLTPSLNGRTAIVDGNQGFLYVDPDEETLRQMQLQLAKEQETQKLLLALKKKESITPDGKRVKLCANIGNTRDLDMVLQNDAEGIGLFRSEFLYLEKREFPTEEEQFQIYKTAAETMAGKPVIIRTLDIGADKQVDYFHLDKEENPAMGYRAIRICLDRPDIFRTQLRALYRASAYGNLSVMYPMITSVHEVRKIKAMAMEIQKELDREGIPYKAMEQGIMIETPAAAMTSDLLAAEVDFFSIGTNDLTQYTLAIDRQNQALRDFYNPHHTAVVRMIHMIAQNAHKAGIWCGICGELAADPQLTPLFLSMGIDELSVAPAHILPLRKLIREINVDCRKEKVFKEWL